MPSGSHDTGSRPAPGVCEGCEDPGICHLIESPCNGFGLVWDGDDSEVVQ